MKQAVEQRVSGGNDLSIALPIVLITLATVEFYLMAVAGYSLSVVAVGAVTSSATAVVIIPLFIDLVLLVAGIALLHRSPWLHYYRSVLSSLISDLRDSFLPHAYYLTYRRRVALIIVSMFISLVLVGLMTPALDLAALFRRPIPTNEVIRFILLFVCLASCGLVLCTAAIAMHRSRMAVSLLIVFGLCYALALSGSSNVGVQPSETLSVFSAFIFTVFVIVAGPVQLIIQYGDFDLIEVVVDSPSTSWPASGGVALTHIDYMPPQINALHFAPIEFMFDRGGRSVIVLTRRIGTELFSVIDISNRRRVAATDREIKIWDLTAIQSHFTGPFEITDAASFFRASGLVSASPGRPIQHGVFSQKSVALAGRLFFESLGAIKNALVSRVGGVLSAYSSSKTLIESLNSLRKFVDVAILTLENSTSAAETLDVRFDSLSAAFQHRRALINEIKAKADVATKWFEWFNQFEHQTLPEFAGRLQSHWQESLKGLILQEDPSLTEEERDQALDLINAYSLRLDSVKIEFAGALANSREHLRDLRDKLLEMHRVGREKLEVARATVDDRKWALAQTMIAQTGGTPQMIEALLGVRTPNPPGVSDMTKAISSNPPPDEEL